MPVRYSDHAPRGHTAAVLLSCALAAGLGAALMYFLDPDLGRARRTALEQSGRRRAPGGDEPVDDAVLVERVRMALGRTIANPNAIDVKAFEGRVVLKGPVTPEELAEIVACTGRVRGVREVDNRLSPNTGIGVDAHA
jgi:BON domain-containing protein